MLYSDSGAYIGRVELPEANTTFYGTVTIPQQHGTSTVSFSPVKIIAIPTTVAEYPVLVPSVIKQCDPRIIDKFCNANFTTSLCMGWGNPSLNFRYELPFDPLDRHDFTFEFLSSTAAGSVTVLARCDSPPSPSQFDKTMLAIPNTVSKLYIPTICTNTTRQSTVYISLSSSASPSLLLDAAGTLSVTVIATETIETLQQELRAAQEAASKALPAWATALIVIFALVALVATIVVAFFLKRARNALETLQSKAETVMDNRHKKYGQLEDDDVAAAEPVKGQDREMESVRSQV